MNDPLPSELLLLSLRGSVFVLAILAVRALIGRRLPAPCLHLLWLLAAVKFLLPIGPAADWSIYNLAASVPLSGREEVPAALPPPRVTYGDSSAASAAPAVVAPGHAAMVEVSPMLPRPTVRRVSPLTMIWEIGIAFQVLVVGFAAIRFRRRLRHAVPIDDERIMALLDECRRFVRMRRIIPMMETSEVQQPSLHGVFRPRILVPPGLLSRLDDVQLRLVLLHEINHARRWDIAALWLFTAMRIAHWFNPLAWLAVRIARRDLEQACDASVLRHAPNCAEDYGHTLLELSRGIPVLHAPAVPLAGIVDAKAALADRLRRLHRGSTAPWKTRLATAVAAIAATLVFGANEKSLESVPILDSPSEEIRTEAKFSASIEPTWISIAKGGDIADAEVEFRLPKDELKSVKRGENVQGDIILESIAWSADGETADIALKRGANREVLLVPGERISQRGVRRGLTAIEFDARLFEIDALSRRSFLRQLRAVNSTDRASLDLLDGAIENGKAVQILTPPQAEIVAQFLTGQKAADLASTAQVTTRSGQRAVIEIIREFRYPSEWKNSLDKDLPATPVSFETRNCGFTLEIEPVLRDDSLISVAATPQAVEFLGMVDTENAARFPRKRVGRSFAERVRGSGILKTHGRPVRTVFSTRKSVVQMDLLSGYTALVTGLAETEDVSAFASIAPKGQLVMLMRASVVANPMPARAMAGAFSVDSASETGASPSVPAASPEGTNSTAEGAADSAKASVPLASSPPNRNPGQASEIQQGSPVPGKPGYVLSPYALDKGYVDVRGFPSGTEIRCPYTQRIFLVP